MLYSFEFLFTLFSEKIERGEGKDSTINLDWWYWAGEYPSAHPYTRHSATSPPFYSHFIANQYLQWEIAIFLMFIFEKESVKNLNLYPFYFGQGVKQIYTRKYKNPKTPLSST